jgi:hypothetical protein
MLVLFVQHLFNQAQSAFSMMYFHFLSDAIKRRKQKVCFLYRSTIDTTYVKQRCICIRTKIILVRKKNKKKSFCLFFVGKGNLTLLVPEKMP